MFCSLFFVLLAACQAGDPPGEDAGNTNAGPSSEAYAPEISAADFVAGVDHPYMPLAPGNHWTYEAETDEGLERTEVLVLDETREVMGVRVVVVRDTVFVDDQMVEDTYDWFAQDRDGNVWYMGEDVKNYEGGVFVDSDGAWEAGIDGALPGIIMWADPRAGEDYRQEYYAGEAEDMARVLGREARATVPFGSFENLLEIREWTPLEPGVAEQKLFAAGVGMVVSQVVEGGDERAELIDFGTR